MGWRVAQTPAGEVPIRSVTLASDGSSLVAGNNKVTRTPTMCKPADDCQRDSVMSGKSMTNRATFRDSKPSPGFKLTQNTLHDAC